MAGGFARGSYTIEGVADTAYAGRHVVVLFQNEFLLAREFPFSSQSKEAKEAGAAAGGQVLATVPDLICCIDSETGSAVPVEEIRYGLRVSLLVIACSPVLRTEAALKVVGPSAFGYDVKYSPAVPTAVQTPSLIPATSTE